MQNLGLYSQTLLCITVTISKDFIKIYTSFLKVRLRFLRQSDKISTLLTPSLPGRVPIFILVTLW
ncbi:hypothetical protein E2C01_036383 [Portunus trituberculatus]|uniref:Uncharacterized protein n=1 Tax=Portunus trituberculatus TaxID=210409 RepID=A0A5B7F8K5_PORTR|nr:hypothetical protein [Portunus trituberculatus]